MAKVIKQNGRFVLAPDPALLARARAAEDLVLLASRPAEGELLALLERILRRLERLEQRS